MSIMLEPSLLLKRAGEYLEMALQKEREKKYDSAREYYLMAAKALLETAKAAKGNIKEIRIRNAEKLIEKAKSLPKTVKEVESKESKRSFILSERPKIIFEDVAGLEEVKEKIRDIIITPFLYPEKAKKWKVKTGGGVLLFGPPGTGKTYLAKAVAGELDADFFYVRASDIMSKFVGESEKRVAELFKQARASGKAVVFIDEIDALLPKRSGMKSTVMQRVVPQFLAEMDGIDSRNDNILLMAATNIPWNIDPAALRPGRFDFKFYIPPPDFEARKKIFQLNLDVPSECIDFDVLAEKTEGYSGADIKFICDEVKRMMFRREIEGREELLRTEHVLEVIPSVKPSIDERMLKKYLEFDSGKLI